MRPDKKLVKPVIIKQILSLFQRDHTKKHLSRVLMHIKNPLMAYCMYSILTYIHMLILNSNDNNKEEDEKARRETARLYSINIICIFLYTY